MQQFDTLGGVAGNGDARERNRACWIHRRRGAQADDPLDICQNSCPIIVQDLGSVADKCDPPIQGNHTGGSIGSNWVCEGAGHIVLNDHLAIEIGKTPTCENTPLVIVFDSNRAGVPVQVGTPIYTGAAPWARLNTSEIVLDENRAGVISSITTSV